MKSFSDNQSDTEQIGCRLWALFALIVYAPLPLASNRPWALALLGLLTGCLLLWTVWRADVRMMGLAWERAKIPLMLLGLWMTLLIMQLVPFPGALINTLSNFPVFDHQSAARSTLSIDPYSTRLYLAKACILTAVFWLVIVLVNSNRRIVLLAKVIVFSGLLQALIGVILMAAGVNLYLFFVEITQPRGHGTFVSPNQYAGYLELTLATGIGLMIAKLDGRTSVNWRKRLHGWLAVLLSGKAMLRLALIIMVVGLVASRSRGGNSAFFASLLITGLLTVILLKRTSGKKQRVNNLMHSTMIFITSLIVLDVVIIGGMVGVEKVVQRIENTNLASQTAQEKLNATRNVTSKDGVNAQVLPVYVPAREESVEDRGQAILPSLQIVRDFPFIGTGGGTFFLAFQHYRPAEIRGYYEHAHDDYVEFASESGLLGFMLLAALITHSVWRSFKSLLKPSDQLTQGMVFASLMGIISLLIHAAVDFNFQNPANAMLFLILLSLPYLLKSQLIH